jgi:hypothetical protein
MLNTSKNFMIFLHGDMMIYIKEYVKSIIQRLVVNFERGGVNQYYPF